MCRSGTLCAALLSLCVAAPAFAAERQGAAAPSPEPYRLSAAEMDGVTAGIQLDLIGAAVATGGSFNLTEVAGGGVSSSSSTPGGGTVESGVVGGTAAAISTGGSASAGVTTSGATSGAPLVTISGGGTLASPLGQTSVSFVFVSGGTFFLP
jgi:hypothetical protein